MEAILDRLQDAGAAAEARVGRVPRGGLAMQELLLHAFALEATPGVSIGAIPTSRAPVDENEAAAGDVGEAATLDAKRLRPTAARTPNAAPAIPVTRSRRPDAKERVRVDPGEAATLDARETDDPGSPLRPEVRAAVSALRDPARFVGRTLGGRYRVEARVGGGAFGDVFRAMDTEVRGHRVAIKLLHEPCLSDDERERALRELRLIASVFHPSIVQFKDHGWYDQRLWFVMPWYEGETLESRLEKGALTRAEARAVFEPLARALASMHARGIRHQDIKPDNIFLAELPGQSTPLPLLIDLGVAAEDAERLVAGTPTYFAPEVASQFAAEASPRAVGHAADVFSLALSLRNALEPGSREDIPGGALEAFIERRAQSTPALPRNPALRYLRSSLSRWLSLDPSARPTALELAEELSVLGLPEARRARRRRALAFTLPLAVAAGVLGTLGAQHLKAQHEAKQRQVAAAQAAAAGLREDLSSSRARVESLMGRVRQGDFSRRELQLTLAANSGRLRRAEEVTRGLEQRIHELSEAREAQEHAAEALRRTLEGARAESAAAQTRASNLDDALAAIRENERALTTSLREREAALSSVRSELRTTEAARDEAEARTAQARVDTQAARARLDAQIARADTLEANLREAVAGRVRAESALRDARRRPAGAAPAADRQDEADTEVTASPVEPAEPSPTSDHVESVPAAAIDQS